MQIISVEQNGHLKKHRTSIRPHRTRRKRRERLLLKIKLIGLLAVCFFAVCFVTNWFEDMPSLPFRHSNSKEKIEAFAKKEDYPTELIDLLEQNEETYDFVENYAKREQYQGKEIDLSRDYQAGSIPLLLQWDKRWGYDLYGESMIGLAGCGPTCMTMAYLYYTGDTTMNPRKMAEFAQDQGYHTIDGTSWDFWTAGADALGLSGETVSLNEATMKGVLDAGGLLVCSMSPGDFTTGGHYILLRGYDESGFFVNDPNRKSNSEKKWDFETLAPQIKNLWAIYG